MKMNRIVLIALLVAVLSTIITAYEMRELDEADPLDVGTGAAVSAQPAELIPAGAVTPTSAVTPAAAEGGDGQHAE